jgi:hypothetical protein
VGPDGSSCLGKARRVATVPPQAKAIIRDLLEPGESLADASTWADENSREIAGSAGWHFVNVPVNRLRRFLRFGALLLGRRLLGGFCRTFLPGRLAGLFLFLDTMFEGALAKDLLEVREPILSDNWAAHGATP